jgi:hypothetical protein
MYSCTVEVTMKSVTWKHVTTLANNRSSIFQSIEVWISDNIVTNIKKNATEKLSNIPSNDALINPANQTLVGTQLSYFPVGGPIPSSDLEKGSAYKIT